MTELSKRKYPYSHRAALSISNDIDGLAYLEFLEWHRYLNNKDPTALGPGLDLDVGDSFWFFSCKPEITDAFSYFEGVTDRMSPNAPAIRALAESGYLDTLHSWGNFSLRGGFERKLAERGATELARWKRRPLVWCDHGDENNFQNLTSGRGDLAGAKEYHSDVLASSEIPFVWGPNDVSDIWGQDRRLTLAERIRLRRHPGSPWASLREVLTAVSNSSRVQSVLRPDELRDGTPVIRFTRYLRDWDHTNADDLREVLHASKLDALEKTGGTSLILIHLGFGAPIRSLSPDTPRALADLARRHHEGRIWVRSTERLLLYLFARENVETRLKHDSSYELVWKNNPPKGIESRGIEAFDGLTFFLPAGRSIELTFNGKALPLRKNPPTGKESGSVTVETFSRPSFPYDELRDAISS